MRISDWRSDVCSSVLRRGAALGAVAGAASDLLRRGPRELARGPRARLLRRPLRRSRRRALRGPPARRGPLRQRRCAGRADPAGLRRGAGDPGRAGRPARMNDPGPRIDKTRAMADKGWEPIAVRTEADPEPTRAGDGKKVRHLVIAQDPIVGPGPTPEEEAQLALPRLARHQIVLDDGHQVGVAVCGQGVPLVVVHGFSAEGILYAQTLSRLVDLGFKVIAVDTAGHGGTLGLPTSAQSMQSYAELLGRVLDHLGVSKAVLVGHSMGGRLVAELARSEEHTSELQSLMRNSYAVFCLKTKIIENKNKRSTLREKSYKREQ